MPVLVIETAPGVVEQAVMHVVLLVRKVVQVVPEQECEVGEVVRHKMSQEWHKAAVTVGRVDVLFSSDNLCVLTRHGDFVVWKSTRVHQCTQLQVIRPDGKCTCKVKRITFTNYLRKHLNTQCNATSAPPSHTKSVSSCGMG